MLTLLYSLQLFRDRRMWPRLYDEDMDEIQGVMNVDTTAYMGHIRDKVKLMQQRPNEEEMLVTWVSGGLGE